MLNKRLMEFSHVPAFISLFKVEQLFMFPLHLKVKVHPLIKPHCKKAPEDSPPRVIKAAFMALSDD